MRYNERELKHVLQSQPANLEGNLTYYDPKEGSKDRKARLVKSLLALYRVSPNGVFTVADPAEVIVLVNISVEVVNTPPNSFEIVCHASPTDTCYRFSCANCVEQQNWLTALKHLSYSSLFTQANSLNESILKHKVMKSQGKRAPTRPPPPPPRRLPVQPAPPPLSKDNSENLLIDFS